MGFWYYECFLFFSAWSIFGDLDGEIFITLTAIIVVLLLLAILLLGHLLCFHIFLSELKLYNYYIIVFPDKSVVLVFEQCVRIGPLNFVIMVDYGHPAIWMSGVRTNVWCLVGEGAESSCITMSFI
jgi:hypothetical protein